MRRKYGALVTNQPKGGGENLTPELIAKMDAEEAAFNRLRDYFGAFSQLGESGSTAANFGRGGTGMGRHR